MRCHLIRDDKTSFFFNSGEEPRLKSPSFRNTIELLSRSVCLLESFDNLSSLCHLSPFTHQPLFIWRPLPSLARTQNSHSFPGRRPNPTFAAVWVRLFVGELEFDQTPQHPRCERAITLQSASKRISVERRRVSSHG